MKNPRVIFIACILIFTALIGLGVAKIGKQGKDSPESFRIDYKKLESLAAAFPGAERYVEFLRRDEGLLKDEDPVNDADAYFNIGFNLHVLQDYETAIRAYKEALKIRPEDPIGLNNIAESYKAVGNLKEAERFYRELVRVNPGEANAYIDLAEVLRPQYPDDEEGVKNIIESGIEVVLEPAELLSYLGVYFRDRGNIKKAIEYFEKLTKLYPDNNLYKGELEELEKKL